MEIPVDLSEKPAPFEHDGVTWSLAYLPLGKDDELRAAFSAAYKPILDAKPAEGGDVEPYLAAQRAARPALLRAYAEIVRWGVSGWTLSKLPAVKVRESYAGAQFDVLARAPVEVLARVDRGTLLEELALQVLKVNALSQEDLLGFL